MSADIIPFPRGRVQTDRASHERTVTSHRRAKLSQIKAKLENAPRRFTANDSLNAAIALRDLTDEARQRGVAMRSFQEAFEKIHRYLPKKGFDVSDRKQCIETAKNLPKQVIKWLIVAEKVASVANIEARDAQIRVLEKTNIWIGEGNSLTPSQDQAIQLTAMLDATVGSVMQAKALHEFFATARRVPGRWDLDNHRFVRDTGACLRSSVLLDWFEDWYEAPPVPSVPIGWLRSSPVLTAKLHLASSTQPIPIQFSIRREIRIAIGPTTGRIRIGPLFETRGVVHLTSAATTVAAASPHNTFGFLDEQEVDVVIEGQRQKASIQFDKASDLQERLRVSDQYNHFPFSDLDMFCENFEQNYISWTSFDPIHLAHYLDRDLHVEEAGLSSPANQTPEVGDAWFPRGTLAYGLECYLRSGRFRTDLEDECDQLLTAFRDHKAVWYMSAETATAAFLKQIDDLPPEGGTL